MLDAGLTHLDLPARTPHDTSPGAGAMASLSQQLDWLDDSTGISDVV